MNFLVPSFSVLLYSLVSAAAAAQAQNIAQDGNSRQSREFFKGFTGYRLYNDSVRMVYFNDLTIAVVEIGNGMTLQNCELIEVFSDEQREQALRNLNKLIGRSLKLPFADMMELMTQCEELDPKIINKMIQSHRPVSEAPDDEVSQSPLFSGILPDTKWCGPGDIAKNYFDLGVEWEVDKCCRKHDLCPVKIRANGSRYSLSNKSLYTKSHCQCDDELAKCLKRSKKSAANFMGNIYYNVLRIQCLADGKNGKFYRSARNY